MNTIKRLLRDTSGATAVEYGLILGCIVALLPLVIAPIGTAIAAGFNSVNTLLATYGVFQ